MLSGVVRKPACFLATLALVIDVYISYIRRKTFQFLIRNVSDPMREGKKIPHREKMEKTQM